MAAIADRIYTKAHDWSEFIAKMHSGDALEVDSEIFYYFLEVLPPVFMGRTIRGQRYSFGMAEGEETIVGFWKVKSLFPAVYPPDGMRYFCRDLGIMNRPWG